MKKVQLKTLPPWLAMAPWVVVACALMLVLFVVGIGLRSAQREAAFMTNIMVEKGTSLINALEGALRTGMGFHWTDDELQDVLEKIAQQPDIKYMVLVNPRGIILASSRPELTGTHLMPVDVMQSIDPQSKVQWYVPWVHEMSIPRDKRANYPALDYAPVFQVYRDLGVPQFDERLRGYGHMRSRKRHNMEEGMLFQGKPIALVAYDTTALEEARTADTNLEYTISAVLVFLAIVGTLTFFLVQAYRQSRRVFLESTAFSSEVIRTLPVGIIATDIQQRITSINPSAERILGKDKLEGQNLAELLPSLWHMVEDQLCQGKAVVEQEISIAVPGKSRIPLAVSASRIVTEDGTKTGCEIGNAFILRDLGEIRHLQTALRQRERLAALGNMAAGIAHEVRNPLGAIKGLARFFSEISPENSEEARVAGIMTTEVQRLDKVVGDMLDFARPDSLHVSTLMLDDLIERARRMAQPDIDAGQVDFVADVPPLACTLDSDRITQALLNIFLNALQAMEKAPEKKLRVHASCEAPDTMLLRISDTGCGISPEALQEIFSPYFTTKARGTGLGLSIVHKIMESHEGSIEVESTLGKGTTITLRFPFQDIQDVNNSNAQCDRNDKKVIHDKTSFNS